MAELKFSTEEFAKNVSEKVLDEFLINDKTMREWIAILEDELAIRSKVTAKLEKRKEYIFEKDDRTFSNRETKTGDWVDGWMACYDEVMKILKSI